MATTLSITSAPVGTSLNALLYPVSGNCDTGQGDVVVTVGTPNESSTVNCVNGSYNAFLNISGVTENPMSVTALQNGNNKSFLPNPINDQNGPVSAPIATAPGVVIGGTSYNLAINCNEAQEIVSITGNGIDPDPQTHICAGSGLENFELNIKQGVSFSSPNNLTISSTDEYENPSQSTTSVDVAIDTLAPTILISNGGDIIEGQTASFTITVTDDNITGLNYTPTISSGTLNPSTCTMNPCNITTEIISLAGQLTLTVPAYSVIDDVGNTGDAVLKSSKLIVIKNLSPRITNVSIESTDNDADSWYENSDTITIAVQFDEVVTVSTAGGTPSILVKLTSGTKTAIYTTGTGTNTLSFNFTVSNGDEQCDGNLLLGSLALNGGTIKDTLGKDSNNSELALSVLGAQVDAVKPSLGSVLINTNNSYDDRSATVSWKKFDSCGVTTVKKSIGGHDGSTCNDPSSILPYENLGDLSSFQAQSGISPFNTFKLYEGVKYCSSVIAIDQAGNESDPLESPFWNYYKSCNSHRVGGATVSGTYTIHNNVDLGPISVYCDMVTQGGGWTLVIRYDKNNASSSLYNLPVGSGQTNINLADMSTIVATSNMSASIDIAPFISNGATHFMHVGTTSGSVSYDRTYFSEIYQAVIDVPENIFELKFDTNDSENVTGTSRNWSATLKNRWYDSDFSVMTNTQSNRIINNDNSKRAIDGGEGQGMWTNGSREGALYSSGVNNTSIMGHINPKVQWGFIGKDGTQQRYGGLIHVGTYCRNDLNVCVPPSRMNLMFVR